MGVGARPEQRGQAPPAVWLPDTSGFPRAPDWLVRSFIDPMNTAKLGDGCLTQVVPVAPPPVPTPRLAGARFMRSIRKVMVGGVTAAVTTAVLVTAPTASADPSAPNLRRGSTGPAVECVQMALNIANQNVAVDGVFGQATYNGVINVQRLFNLSTDGIVGRNTGEALWFIYDNVFGANSWVRLRPDDTRTKTCYDLVPSNSFVI